MRKINTTITLNPQDKKQAMTLLKDFGLDLSTFVSMAIKQMIREQKIPFEIGVGTFNRETKEALSEYKEMKKNRKKYKAYKNFNEILAEV